MNLKTAALRLGVHYQTAYRWVRSGRLVAVKVGAGYEISEAAIARLEARRAATERTPERADGDAIASGEPSCRDDALHVIDLMVDAVCLDSGAVSGRAARAAAEHLGDTAYLYRRSPNGAFVTEHAAHRDPVSEVAAVALGRDPRTPNNLVRRAVESGEVVYVPQVPQQVLRERLHPELHEHLHLCGCYSAVCAPIGVDGALLVTRDAPGRPYAADDLDFVQALAARVALADERARGWTAAWEVRRAMVVAFEAPVLEGGCFDALLESVSGGDPAASQPALAVLDLELTHVAANKAYGALLGHDASGLSGVPLPSLVRDRLAFDDALAPVLRGEIDFRSVELEASSGAHVALHVAMVRRADATPRGVAVVAHSVPVLANG